MNKKQLTFSIQDQIDKQSSFIKELSSQKEKIDSDLALAKEMLDFLQSKIDHPNSSSSNQNINISRTEDDTALQNRRTCIRPDVADEKITLALQSANDKEFGMTNPEIERFLIQRHSVAISKNGIKNSLQRLIDRDIVKNTNPSQKQNKRYAIIENEEIKSIDDLI